jgi:hypothetical protein
LSLDEALPAVTSSARTDDDGRGDGPLGVRTDVVCAESEAGGDVGLSAGDGEEGTEVADAELAAITHYHRLGEGGEEVG